MAADTKYYLRFDRGIVGKSTYHPGEGWIDVHTFTIHSNAGSNFRILGTGIHTPKQGGHFFIEIAADDLAAIDMKADFMSPSTHKYVVLEANRSKAASIQYIFDNVTITDLRQGGETDRYEIAYEKVHVESIAGPIAGQSAPAPAKNK